jgi:branched-chain amino acid transport system substrate-binding protein
LRRFIPLILLVLLLAACQSGPSPSSNPDILIASSLTDKGPDYGNVKQLEDAIALAVRGAGHIGKFKLGYLPLSDYLAGGPSQAKGVQNVRQMIADARVLGMIGPFSSSMSYVEIPVANPADLTMLSPSNTNECVTRELAFCPAGEPSWKGLKHANNYFRIAAPDSLQARAMARYISGSLGVKRVAAFNEWGASGSLFLKELGDELARNGGKLVFSQTLPDGTTGFGKFLASATSAGAQAIYAVGSDHVCAARAQMASGPLGGAYFLATDAALNRSGYSTQITDNDPCIKDAVKNSEGMLTTFADVDPAYSTDAESIQAVAAYRKAYPNYKDISIYTFAAFDCARILIDAIDRAMRGNQGNLPTRAQVVAAVAQAHFQGVTGAFSFDAHGDAVSPLMSVYKVQNGHWVYVKPIDASAK